VHDKKVSEIAWKKVGEISYLEMLPGSREFVWHLSKKQNLPLKGEYGENSCYIEFRKVLSPENTRKRYQLTYRVNPNETNPYVVIRLWGRIGGQLKSDIKEFNSHQDACGFFISICSTRIKHGYTISGVDEARFPDREWLERHRNLIDPEFVPQLYLFS
jgi:predicted DNA-binding WGR domain protein